MESFASQGGWFCSLLSSGSAARACFQSCCSHIQKVPQHDCGPGFGHCPILWIQWLTWTFLGSAGESHLCIQAHANCFLNDKKVIPVNKDTHRHVSFYNPMYPADHNHTCFSIRKTVVVIDSSSFTLFLLLSLTAHSFFVNFCLFCSYTGNCTTHPHWFQFESKIFSLNVYTLWIFQFIPDIKFSWRLQNAMNAHLR